MKKMNECTKPEKKRSQAQRQPHLFGCFLIRLGGRHRLGELLVWCTSLSSEKREKAKTKKKSKEEQMKGSERRRKKKGKMLKRRKAGGSASASSPRCRLSSPAGWSRASTVAVDQSVTGAHRE